VIPDPRRESGNERFGFVVTATVHHLLGERPQLLLYRRAASGVSGCLTRRHPPESPDLAARPDELDEMSDVASGAHEASRAPPTRLGKAVSHEPSADTRQRFRPTHLIEPDNHIGLLTQPVRPSNVNTIGDPSRCVGNSFDDGQPFLQRPNAAGRRVASHVVEVIDGHVKELADPSGKRRLAAAGAAGDVDSRWCPAAGGVPND
jgi:hypothetical protein